VTTTQIKSRDRVRDLAEVFTHEREVNAMLDLVADMFPSESDPGNTDRLFLEPACGHGNFLAEILRRKLATVTTKRYGRGDRFEHRVLRCAASTYGIDISNDNVLESRERMTQVVADEIGELSAEADAALAAILETNIIQADSLAHAGEIELVEYLPGNGGFFTRVWSRPLDPAAATPSLFTPEPRRDAVPVHYSELARQIGPTTVGFVGRKAA
jgi:SAM-dependent methyltransferase